MAGSHCLPSGSGWVSSCPLLVLPSWKVLVRLLIAARGDCCPGPALCGALVGPACCLLASWASQPAPDRRPFPSAQRSGERPLLPPVGELPGHGLQRLNPEDPGPHGGPAALHTPRPSGEGISLGGVAWSGVEVPPQGDPSLGTWGGVRVFCTPPQPGQWGEVQKQVSNP